MKTAADAEDAGIHYKNLCVPSVPGGLGLVAKIDPNSHIPMPFGDGLW
jgi:hypothetical protein